MCSQSRLFLDIGCGENPHPQATHSIDVRNINGSIKADAKYLPFKDTIFNHVHSSHVLEHMSPKEVDQAIHEWARILKHNGRFELIVPNLRSFRMIKKLILDSLSLSEDDQNMLYGTQDYLEGLHKSGFTYKSLESLLKRHRIKTVAKMCRSELEYLNILPFLGNRFVCRLYNFIRLSKFLRRFFPTFNNECYMLGTRI